MALTLNGAPVTATPLPAVVEPEPPHRVLLFLQVVAMACEARRDLADAVRRCRNLERKLADPVLADHPDRPRGEAKLARQRDLERDATRRVIETNVNLQRTWDRIDAADKHRYALTFIVGQTDPAMNILGDLWCDDRGLALLVPWPDGWAVPHGLEHRCFDTSTRMRSYTIEEVMRREYASF